MDDGKDISRFNRTGRPSSVLALRSDLTPSLFPDVEAFQDEVRCASAVSPLFGLSRLVLLFEPGPERKSSLAWNSETLELLHSSAIAPMCSILLFAPHEHPVCGARRFSRQVRCRTWRG